MAHDGESLVEGREDPFDVEEELRPGIGRFDVPRGAFEQADAQVALHLRDRAGDARVPAVVGLAQYGVVYTGGTKKIAEHGGAHSDDLDVPLVVSGASVPDGVRDSASVQTKQIAPTILSLLGLNPRSLQAVREEYTAVLPVR